MEQLDVLDWRRRVAALYAAVREATDPREAHARWRDGRDELLRHHPASPVPPAARAGYPGADVAPYDPAFCFVVEVRPTPSLRRSVVAGDDGTVEFDRIGRVVLPGVGSLDVWWLAGYGGGVFLPVRDAWPDSYPGGRYVLDTVKGADLGGSRSGLVVDLNFAYQPSCAYSPEWTCPLPAEGNRVEVVLPVGERYRPLD